MKSLFIILAILLAGNLSAQENPPFLELTITLGAFPCETDTNERSIVLEQIGKDQVAKIGTYYSNGCLFKLSQALAAGQYAITISSMGFDEQKIRFEVPVNNNSKLILNPITLSEKINSLAEVPVYGDKKEFLKIESDKTIVNVKDNAMLHTGSTFDAVKKLPGVITSPTGSLTLNGKAIAVYINGTPNTLSGPDLQNYLSGLRANAIEKVELIYNPGASYEANSSGSVINIVTASKPMEGINASFNINYNFNKYHKPSPHILTNGRQKKTELANDDRLQLYRRRKPQQEKPDFYVF